ncbi:MAG: hypothetical protein ACLSAP_11860 [Oscillospiraceae bacterium]
MRKRRPESVSLRRQDAFTEALAAAKDVYTNGDAMQADVDKAYDDLFGAFMNLVPKATSRF